MKSWHSLDGKNVWVTGGAGYLGTPITTALDAECAKVVCIDLPGRAEGLVRDGRLARTVAVSLDLSRTESLETAIDEMAQKHGVPDGLVHLAYASSSGKRLEELLPTDFKKAFDQALTPTFVLCRALAARMKARGSGSIVLFSSMYGLVAPDPGIYSPGVVPNPIDYGASKAGVLQLARYLAMHYGPSGVRFNCVTPGPFPNPAVQRAQPETIANQNKKTFLRRIGRNHEVVGPALFLLSDGASYVTGQSLVVDGGWTSW